MPINRHDHPAGTVVRIVDPPHSGVDYGTVFTIERWAAAEPEVYVRSESPDNGGLNFTGTWFASRFEAINGTAPSPRVRCGIWCNTLDRGYPPREQAYWVAIPGFDPAQANGNHPSTIGYRGEWAYWGWRYEDDVATLGEIMVNHRRWTGTPEEYTPPIPWIETLPPEQRTWRTYLHAYWLTDSGGRVFCYAPSQPGPDWGVYADVPMPPNQYCYICRDDNDPCLRTRCAHCAAMHPLNHAWQPYPGYHGSRICTACQSTLFTCACGSVGFVRVDTGNDEEVCPPCAESRGHVQCVGCDEWTPNEDMHEGPDGSYRCEYCHNDVVSSCDDCGAECFREDMDDNGNCNDCREQYYYDDDDGGGVIRGYSDRAANRLGPFGAVRRDQRGRDKTVRFGVELEVEVSDRGSRYSHAERFLSRIGTDFAVCKDDGSLSNGFEVVTAPADLATHTERWTEALDPMPHGLRSFKTDTCGMHVHVSRKPLTQLQIGKALVFVNAEENKGFITAVAGRTGERWAKRFKKRIKDVRLPSDRYQAINITGEHTIEFRIFKGTLKLAAVLKNIEFCAAVMEWCGNESMLRLGWVDFTRYVMATPRAWPNLSAWLRAKGYAKAAKEGKDSKRPDPSPEIPPVPGTRRHHNGREEQYMAAGDICLYPNGQYGAHVLNEEGWHWYDARSRLWYPAGTEAPPNAEAGELDDGASPCTCNVCVASRQEAEAEVPF